MEMFWRTKGKRIAAWLMIALIMATTIPFGSISASADDTTTDESDAVTITGQVMVPGNDDENTDTNNGTPYAGAKVTVTYPQSGSTPVTNEATTTDDGKFNISIGNWTLNTDNKYTVKVEPADVDKGTYDSYSSEEKTVTEDQVKTKKIELGTITLKEKSVPYSVTANVETSDNSAKNDAGEVKVENNVVTATPKEGYEITAVTVKKETADWKPDGETNDNWWNKNINASGAFVYEEFKDKTLDANYAFTVTFAKKQFTITYKISQNGKLILNSDAQNDKVEITTESGEDGSRNVPYTDSEYKIKAAVTDNKYHLTSFRVDNDEKLNENEINNSLKEKEYIFSEGIKQAHSIEVTAEIDTYTVSVTTDDGGIVEVNGSSEKNIIVDSGAEVAIIVKPNEGKTVKIFSVNGTPIQENNLTEDEDGTAVYKIENVNGDQNVTAEFEDIQNENKDSLALAGLNLLDSGNNQITADEDGNYYSSSAILKFDGKTKISLSQWGVGRTQLNLTETTIISSEYKGGIIGRKQISLNPSAHDILVLYHLFTVTVQHGTLHIITAPLEPGHGLGRFVFFPLFLLLERRRGEDALRPYLLRLSVGLPVEHPCVRSVIGYKVQMQVLSFAEARFVVFQIQAAVSGCQHSHFDFYFHKILLLIGYTNILFTRFIVSIFFLSTILA